MRILLLLLLGWLSIGCSKLPRAVDVEVEMVALEQAEHPQPSPELWPRPKERQSLAGEGLSWKGRLSVHCPDESIRKTFEKHFPEAHWLEDKAEAKVTLSIEPDQVQPVSGAYELKVQEGRASLVARDPQGLLYAVQTFSFLAQDRHLEAVSIRDWPTLPWRGILLHTGANSGPTHRRLLERVLVPLKLNVLMVECEYAQWESHPELWVPELSVSKKELEKTVTLAKELKVETIPLVQTLSHMGWMFKNDQNQALGEGNLNYCFPPESERGWSIVFDIYEEAIQLFKPRWFHVGFDELRGIDGHFPGSDKTPDKVMAEQANRLHDYFKERGIKTMIWADRLLWRDEIHSIGFAPSPEVAQELRTELNKEIILVDWQYVLGRWEFSQWPTLGEMGFTLWGAGGDHAPTTQGHARALVRNEQPGLLLTTWPGRILNDQVVEGTEFHQFAQAVVAAEAAWNGGVNEVGQPGRYFRWLWEGRPVSPPPRPGRALLFSGAQTGLTSEPTSYGPVTFVANHRLELDRARSFRLNSKTKAVAFLWSLRGEAGKGTEVARLHCLYQDGQVKTHPVRIRKEVTEGQDQVELYQAPVVWREEKESLRSWSWTNPRGDQVIEKLILEPRNHDVTLLVTGVTLIDPKE